MRTECLRFAQETVLSQKETAEIQDNCGVFGVVLKENSTRSVADILKRGLTELQHRGPVGTGAAIINTERFYLKKNLGLVPEAYPDLANLNEQVTNGNVGVAHLQLGLRPTLLTQEEKKRGLQPFLSEENAIDIPEKEEDKFTLAHNGTIKNILEIARRYNVNPEDHVSDSHMLTSILKHVLAETDNMDAALNILLPQLHGGYALLIGQKDTLYAIRDPWGLRPLVLREFNDRYEVASETAAFPNTHQAIEIERGTVIKITPEGMTTTRIPRSQAVGEALCGPELVAFMRRDSLVQGRRVEDIRKDIGAQLAQEYPPPEGTDLILAVPASEDATKGYAQGKNVLTVKREPEAKQENQPIPLQEGMEEHLPKQWRIPKEIAGKKIVLVENIMGEGRPLKRLIEQLRTAGADVHLRLTFPLITEECDYGMILKQRDEFVNGQTQQEIAEDLGVASLEILSDRGFAIATHKAENDLCKGCTAGIHPPTLQQIL